MNGDVEKEFYSITDSIKLLQLTKSEIKSITYNLERSIKGHDSYFNIKMNEVNEIDVLSNINIYCKVNL